MNRFSDRFVTTWIESQVSNDVFGDHDGVVDHQPDGDRHRSQRHEIEGLPDQVHRENTDRESQRDRRGADCRDTRVVQKEKQDNDGEYRSDDHCVSHGLHRIAHERALIVDSFQPHPRRQSLPHRASEARDAVDDRQRISTGLARNVEESSGFAITGDDADVVFSSERDSRDVSNSQTVTNHHRGNVVGSVRFLSGNYQVLLVILRKPSNSCDAGRFPDGVRQIVIRQSLRRETSWICDYLDFTNIASLNIDTTDTGHSGDEWLELIARDVVECRGIAALEVVRQNRKKRWRHALDFDVELVR